MSPRELEHRSHIVSVRAPLPGIGARLEAEGIVVSERGPYVRFSPSRLNTVEEIERCLEALERVLLTADP
jgi:selenocysteine lyase/cysteine desulfurase